jgi:hypothetical protein
VVGCILNNCPLLLKFGVVIGPVEVYAGFETEIVTNFVTEKSVCINILT